MTDSVKEKVERAKKNIAGSKENEHVIDDFLDELRSQGLVIVPRAEARQLLDDWLQLSGDPGYSEYARVIAAATSEEDGE